ncbi:unnamed protein product [Sphagnum troendelagicum]|uniref:Uncharacterized protein n=1 Tax=Sphagnum troendelagicum TaxID=128251 RepID=A0ABP0T8K1_9BRYO
MERNKKTKRRVTNEEEEGASNSSSSISRVCCATCFWSQTEVPAQEFDRIKKRHQKQTHSGRELCQQFAACMYLCSTLRLA